MRCKGSLFLQPQIVRRVKKEMAYGGRERERDSYVQRSEGNQRVVAFINGSISILCRSKQINFRVFYMGKCEVLVESTDER